MIETGVKSFIFRRAARSPAMRQVAHPFANIAIMLMAFAAGCGPEAPPDGLYVWCDGRVDGLYYIHGISHQVIERFSLPCLGPEFVSETGGTGSGEIDLDEWTNDTEDIDLLRTMCVAECLSQGGTECEQENGKVWQILNYQEKLCRIRS
jgi:hypothetical protein